MTDLRARYRAAYRRCSCPTVETHHPDGTVTLNGQAFLALIELRNMWSEIDTALFELEKAREFVAVPRLREAE